MIFGRISGLDKDGRDEREEIDERVEGKCVVLLKRVWVLGCVMENGWTYCCSDLFVLGCCFYKEMKENKGVRMKVKNIGN